MRTSLTESGVRPESARIREVNAGYAVALPIDTNVPLVLTEVPRRAGLLLGAYNERHVPQGRLQLVIAFAMGPTIDGPSGLIGAAPRTAQQLTHDFAPISPWPLATLVTDTLYELYVVPGFRYDLDPEAFRHIEIGDEKAWLYQPSEEDI